MIFYCNFPIDRLFLANSQYCVSISPTTIDSDDKNTLLHRQHYSTDTDICRQHFSTALMHFAGSFTLRAGDLRKGLADFLQDGLFKSTPTEISAKIARGTFSKYFNLDQRIFYNQEQLDL